MASTGAAHEPYPHTLALVIPLHACRLAVLPSEWLGSGLSVSFFLARLELVSLSLKDEAPEGTTPLGAAAKEALPVDLTGLPRWMMHEEAPGQCAPGTKTIAPRRGQLHPLPVHSRFIVGDCDPSATRSPARVVTGLPRSMRCARPSRGRELPGSGEPSAGSIHPPLAGAKKPRRGSLGA